MVTILGISGSLRRDSFNTAILRAAGEVLPADTTFEIAQIDDLPFYNEDLRVAGYPESVQRFRGQVQAADAVLIAAPEYNYSVSGVLKNAIDWASRPPEPSFNDKPVAIMGASSGPRGTVRGQLHLRQILVSINAQVLAKPEVMVGNTASLLSADGRLVDDATLRQIAALVAALVDWTQRLQR